ncbi:MAG: hypothetical protein AAF761_05970 [Pseudomonadota bacterium]
MTDARDVFEELAQAAIEGRIEDLVARVQLPLAIYLAKNTMVFSDVEQFRRGAKLYIATLAETRLARVKLDVLEEEASRGAEACFLVRASYLDADGNLIGDSENRWFGTYVDGDLRFQVVEVVRMPLPASMLPKELFDEGTGGNETA